MNKTERLLAIMIELQRSRLLTADELAEVLGVSVRTIYRDMQALSEAGVPVIGETGLGYSLMEGYFLPPVSFTVEEAVSLVLGAEFIEKRFDPAFRSSARSSSKKIEAILSGPIREETSRIQGGIRLLQKDQMAVMLREKEHLGIIRGAMLESRKIRFTYNKRAAEADGSRTTVRTVSPYGLAHDEQNGWLLLAYCGLREDIRHFRVSRISELAVTEDTFQTPDNFNLQAYQPKDTRSIRVSAIFNSEIADRVEEANNYYMETAESKEDGYHATFRVREPEELLSWILGWGGEVVVTEPESFRNRIREEIAKMKERY
ncbi:transcriptional regulator [Paenibacillus sp. FSL R7-0273]|uniref:helix-turn-helix transcriptional regulator n=1 Tax=Paenibacillus sp. FSL R7-0273 TaxID=1536772 RepID=UPI0004F65AA4|nr:YafY family protein [Paenibacillus sp. FSL R7-0273]AIQ45767.1 transcriptional regulator [Paenibacillus sp. FSL R7-0273]OMF95290.1 transcriptional regulator [Paenibacillus sp. FSL R7-0273]